MAADELPVLGEGHVAFHDPCAHTEAGEIGLLGVLGELQGGAAMRDREIRPVEGT